MLRSPPASGPSSSQLTLRRFARYILAQRCGVGLVIEGIAINIVIQGALLVVDCLAENMPIPVAQLETWCNQGAVATAQATHNSIRYALETAGTSRILGHNIDIFLQGSYRNATNIYSDSDVDIVVLLNESFTRDPSRLSAMAQHIEQQDFERVPRAAYSWGAFRADVLASLREYYGPVIVLDGNKAIRVTGGNGRLGADVVPAIEHMLYTSYGSFGNEAHIEGITFYDKAWRHIVNFPKEHIANGQAKNAEARTGGNYKPTVRMVKNARRYLVERNRLADGAAPSYFIECLLYNVPDNLFVFDRYDTMLGILRWCANAQLAPMMCQNGVTPLFGPTPEQWRMPSAVGFLNAVVDMWNAWPI